MGSTKVNFLRHQHGETVLAGTEIFRQGEPGDRLSVVREEKWTVVSAAPPSTPTVPVRPSARWRSLNRTSAAPFVIALAACSGAPEPVSEDLAFERAVERCRASDEAGAISALRVALDADPAAYQRALLEPDFHSGLRDSQAFRTAMNDAAVKHRVSSLTLVAEDEPGEWIEVEGHVVDSEGVSTPGAVVHVYATDTTGRYHPEIEGDAMPRIFGTLVADTDGRFVFRTVRPGSYPGTRDARHVHIAAQAGAMRLARPHYAVFDDDPLLFEPQNEEQRGEAIRIAMKIVDGRSLGTMILPMR